MNPITITMVKFQTTVAGYRQYGVRAIMPNGDMFFANVDEWRDNNSSVVYTEKSVYSYGDFNECTRLLDTALRHNQIINDMGEVFE